MYSPYGIQVKLMLDKMSGRVLPRTSQPHRLLADLLAANRSSGESRGGRYRKGPDLTLSSAFLAIQHLATPSSTCTCPRRFPISVMMLMAESYLGKAVCTARWEGAIRLGQACNPSLCTPVASPPGPHGSGGCQQSTAGRVPGVAGPRAAVQSS